MIKICKYRNCDCIIDGRINKLYCNKKCRSNESKYILREKCKENTKEPDK